MPQDAYSEAAFGILDALDSIVVGPGNLAQSFPDPRDALVMMRANRSALSYEPCHPAVGRNGHVVLGKLAGALPVTIVTGHVGQMLDQVTASDDVEQLHPAAHREDRHIAAERCSEEEHLGGVPIGTQRVCVRVLSCPIQSRIDVGSPRKQQPVQGIEGFFHTNVGRGQQ
jgi:hypothetical protein